MPPVLRILATINCIVCNTIVQKPTCIYGARNEIFWKMLTHSMKEKIIKKPILRQLFIRTLSGAGLKGDATGPM